MGIWESTLPPERTGLSKNEDTREEIRAWRVREEIIIEHLDPVVPEVHTYCQALQLHVSIPFCSGTGGLHVLTRAASVPYL